MRALGLLALMGLGVAAQPAHAFNVTNNTDFPVCVFGDQGNYYDVVKPHTTNEGWYLDSSIVLTFEVQDIPIDTCNWHVAPKCTVPPHYAVQINGIHFQPGDPQTYDGQQYAYSQGFPASFDLDCGS